MTYHQPDRNGPLPVDVRRRLEVVRNRLNLTLAGLGEVLGFSGPFVGLLLREDQPGRLRAKHLDRVLNALEMLEARAGVVRGPVAAEEAPRVVAHATLDPAIGQAAQLLALIRTAHGLGFSIELRPLDRSASARPTASAQEL